MDSETGAQDGPRWPKMAQDGPRYVQGIGIVLDLFNDLIDGCELQHALEVAGAFETEENNVEHTLYFHHEQTDRHKSCHKSYSIQMLFRWMELL